ncbi:hypothetical protein B0T22DRAFT_464700 [Podospora appendiculata]|uniref:Uncharacterized protein n=1 Tax=Podospora appendiculata TaxID=314037 RepID=A0AAE0X4U7_9PEZI|nr:hypothetical protein B0T22DRAFT_464700 [Podospora appendiculata]
MSFIELDREIEHLERHLRYLWRVESALLESFVDLRVSRLVRKPALSKLVDNTQTKWDEDDSREAAKEFLDMWSDVQQPDAATWRGIGTWTDLWGSTKSELVKTKTVVPYEYIRPFMLEVNALMSHPLAPNYNPNLAEVVRGAMATVQRFLMPFSDDASTPRHIGTLVDALGAQLTDLYKVRNKFRRDFRESALVVQVLGSIQAWRDVCAAEALEKSRKLRCQETGLDVLDGAPGGVYEFMARWSERFQSSR